MFRPISEISFALREKWVGYRRDFHRYAELGQLEMRTSSLIARQLSDFGYRVLVGEDVCMPGIGMPLPETLEAAYQNARATGGDLEFLEQVRNGLTGVIGILECGNGPVTALRFDIDALGVNEDTSEQHRPTREGFASLYPGVMHACGHDGHAAIGLGVAEVLMGIKDSLHGTVRLIFQPAEESLRGAQAIVEKGHLDDVQFLLAGHISKRLVGKDEGCDIIAGCGGSLAAVQLDVIFRGRAAHAAAAPEEGENSLLAAAGAVQQLYGISRSSVGDTRINVGTLHAGTAHNVIADCACMEIEVRGKNDEVCAYMETQARRIIRCSAEMLGVSTEIKTMGSCDALESDLALMELVATACGKLQGVSVHPQLRREVGGSEDFSCMMRCVREHGGQATMMRFLTDITGVVHGNGFDFDDADILPKAVAVMSAVIYDIHRDHQRP